METVRKEKRRKRVTLEELVNLKESERFFLVKINDKIGYGVFARQNFKALDLLLDYKGEKISTQEAKRRSLFYDYENKGSFIFDGVKDGSNFVSIDATYYHKSFGRYVNDSPKQFTNAKAKRMVIGKEVKIILVATKDIEIGTEIRYDYLEGQRSINYEVMPWRAPQYEPSRPCHFDVEKEIVIVSDTGKKKQLTPSQAIKIMNQSYMEEKEEQSEDNEEKEEQSEDNEEKEEQSEDSEEKEEQSEDNEEKEEQSEDNEEKEEQSEDNEEKEEQSEDNEEKKNKVRTMKKKKNKVRTMKK
uniref:SET domain-containing protein n=2 Tax=Clytia hemisphaerica TaxID=252671 RepID=A0A7M5TS48_9CNID